MSTHVEFIKMKILSVYPSLKTSRVKVSKNSPYNIPNMTNANCTNPTVENLMAYSGGISFGANISGFKKLAVTKANPMWDKLVTREIGNAKGIKDYRDIFDIDSDRILNSS